MTTTQPLKYRRRSPLRRAGWATLSTYWVYDGPRGRCLGIVASSQTTTTAPIWTAYTVGGTPLGQADTRAAAAARLVAKARG